MEQPSWTQSLQFARVLGLLPVGGLLSSHNVEKQSSLTDSVEVTVTSCIEARANSEGEGEVPVLDGGECSALSFEDITISGDEVPAF